MPQTMIFTGSMDGLFWKNIKWLHVNVELLLHNTPHNIWNVDHNPSNTEDGHMVERDRIEDAFYTVYNKGFSAVSRFLDKVLSENLQTKYSVMNNWE